MLRHSLFNPVALSDTLTGCRKAWASKIMIRPKKQENKIKLFQYLLLHQQNAIFKTEVFGITEECQP